MAEVKEEEGQGQTDQEKSGQTDHEKSGQTGQEQSSGQTGQEIKYDPISLRQPEDLHSWNWCCGFVPNWLKKGVIHERVWEVDGRDQLGALLIWLVVFTLYIIYLVVGLSTLFQRRANPPISVEIVNFTEGDYLLNLEVLSSLQGNITEWSGSRSQETGICIPTPMSYTAPGFPNFKDWGDQIGADRLYHRYPLKGTDCSMVYWILATNQEQSPYDPNQSLKNLVLTGSVLKGNTATSSNDIEYIYLNLPQLEPNVSGLTHYTVELQVTRQKKLPSFCDYFIYLGSMPPLFRNCFRDRRKGAAPPRDVWQLRLLHQSSGSFHCPLVMPASLKSIYYGVFLQVNMPKRMTIYEDKEPVTLTSVGGLGTYVVPSKMSGVGGVSDALIYCTFALEVGFWSTVVFVLTLPNGRRRMWSCCVRSCCRPIQFFKKRHATWEDKLKNDLDDEMEDDTKEKKDMVNTHEIIDIAKLELPSMEDRVARTEMLMRRLMNNKPPAYLEQQLEAQQQRLEGMEAQLQQQGVEQQQQQVVLEQLAGLKKGK